MSCCKRVLFFSAIARAVSRRMLLAHFPVNSKVKSVVGGGGVSDGVGVFVVMVFEV
jgi:hypothetical protein